MTSTSISSIIDSKGNVLSGEALKSKFANKRVALYFSAGWCPMCTSFEPDLFKFQNDAAEQNNPVEIIYVSSDRTVADYTSRVSSLNMMSIPFAQAAEWKRTCRIWAGSESTIFGSDRRSGIPALVVLDKHANEMAFLAAEAQGAKALEAWPLDDAQGIW